MIATTSTSCWVPSWVTTQARFKDTCRAHAYAPLLLPDVLPWLLLAPILHFKLIPHEIDFIGDSGRARTCDLPLRRRLLYPTELRSRTGAAHGAARVSMRPGNDAVRRKIVGIGQDLAGDRLPLLDPVGNAVALGVGDCLLLGV